MLGVLGDVSGFRTIHGLNRTSAKNVRVSSDKLKQDKIIEGADISVHTTDDAVSCRVQRADAYSRRSVIKASPRPRAWLGNGWTGSLSAAGWSANSGCDFGSIFTSLVFFAPCYTGGRQTSRINPNRHRSSSPIFLSVRSGL